MMSTKDDEFWDWKPEAPTKIDCDDADILSLTYNPYGCMGCNNMEAIEFEEGRITMFDCKLGHSIVQFNLKRSKPAIKNGRRSFFVMYRTHEPNERPTPIPANLIMSKVDEIASESKPILPAKEKAYGNLFPGGSAEVARRIVEKAQRLTGNITDDENIDDTEQDLYNYIAIHRACRERERVIQKGKQ
jgi:hypothetical protein